MGRDITGLKGNIQNRHKARKPVAPRTRHQVNNNLLSFPYGDRFKKRKPTREEPIKLRLSEARAPEKARID
jgi:hypothetical protein